jgi:GAF domain-containing protein
MTNSRHANAVEALARVARALSETDQPRALFTALDRATADTIGHKLFTLMIFHADAGETERVYTNQPGPYPVGGRKHFAETPWSRSLLRDGRPYVGRTAQDIRDVFFDHELILSLGCASVLNVPIVWRRRVLGTMNLLHEERWYSDDDVPLGSAFAPALVPAFLDLLG